MRIVLEIDDRRFSGLVDDTLWDTETTAAILGDMVRDTYIRHFSGPQIVELREELPDPGIKQVR
jgi:hypothetical protein